MKTCAVKEILWKLLLLKTIYIFSQIWCASMVDKHVFVHKIWHRLQKCNLEFCLHGQQLRTNDRQIMIVLVHFNVHQICGRVNCYLEIYSPNFSWLRTHSVDFLDSIESFIEAWTGVSFLRSSCHCASISVSYTRDSGFEYQFLLKCFTNSADSTEFN